MADVWHRVDWNDAEFGKAFDDYMRSALRAGFRLGASGRANAPAWGELQKRRKVAKTGDLWLDGRASVADTWNAAATKTKAIRCSLSSRTCRSSAIPRARPMSWPRSIPFFTNLEGRRELAKAFRYKMDDGRTTGQHLIERISVRGA